MIPLRETEDVVKETQQHYVAIGCFFKSKTAALHLEGIILYTVHSMTVTGASERGGGVKR